MNCPVRWSFAAPLSPSSLSPSVPTDIESYVGFKVAECLREPAHGGRHLFKHPFTGKAVISDEPMMERCVAPDVPEVLDLLAKEGWSKVEGRWLGSTCWLMERPVPEDDERR